MGETLVAVFGVLGVKASKVFRLKWLRPMVGWRLSSEFRGCHPKGFGLEMASECRTSA